MNSQVYTLKARGAPGIMSTRGGAYSAPYIIAFETLEHAKKIQQFAHDHTKIEICRYSPSKIYEKITGDVAGRIRINKKININKLGCDIEESDKLDFMTYPHIKGLGVILAYEMIREDAEVAIFQAEIIEPCTL